MDANAKVLNRKVIALALVFIAVFCGLIIFTMWWQSEQAGIGPFPESEDLKFPGHTWGTNNTAITLSVKNVGSYALSVKEVRVNGTVVDNVAYGGNFTGTTHTLNIGYVGTITITYPFSSGVSYKLDMITASGNTYPYTTTAP